MEASEAGHEEKRCGSCPLGTVTRSLTTHFSIKHAWTISDGTAQVTSSYIYTQPLSGSENESERENSSRVDHAVVTLELAFTWSTSSNAYDQICKFITKLIRAIFMFLMDSLQSFDDLGDFSFFIQIINCLSNKLPRGLWVPTGNAAYKASNYTKENVSK